jgi:hypothetical protein
LFASRDILAGKEMPVKGPWFHSKEALHTYLAGFLEEIATMLASRVIRVDIVGEQEGEAVHLFKVATCPVGFVNHFTQLSNQPNAVLVWKEGVPLGEHTLVIKSTKVIKAGKQWLLNYGPLHLCGVRVQRKRKRAATPAPEAAEGA